MTGNACVNYGTAKQLFYILVFCHFFLKGYKQTLLFNIGSVRMCNIVIIAVFHKAEKHFSGIRNVSERGYPHRSNLLAAIFIAELVHYVKGGIIYGKIACGFSDLSIYWHISVSLKNFTVGKSYLLTCRNQTTLHTR